MSSRVEAAAVPISATRSEPSRRPLIGIVAHRVGVQEPEGPAAYHGADAAYVRAVRAGGGTPVLIPPGDAGELSAALAEVAGLVLTGGVDMEPCRYGQSPAPEVGPTDPERDGTDLALCDMALESGKPLLAVCRGLQVLNVTLGGTLHQHVEGHSDVAGQVEANHGLHIEAGSTLARWLGDVPAGSVRINSLHHQAVDRLGAGLEVAARSPEGVVEALSLRGSPQVLGVQWHPELLCHLSAHRHLFRHLVGLCS